MITSILAASAVLCFQFGSFRAFTLAVSILLSFLFPWAASLVAGALVLASIGAAFVYKAIRSI